MTYARSHAGMYQCFRSGKGNDEKGMKRKFRDGSDSI